MKKGLFSSGLVASILGAIGITFCCFPFISAGIAGLGLSVLFLHRISQWFLYIGISLIILAVMMYVWKKNDKNKP